MEVQNLFALSWNAVWFRILSFFFDGRQVKVSQKTNFLRNHEALFFFLSQKRFFFLRHQTNALEGLSTIFQTSGERFFFSERWGFFFSETCRKFWRINKKKSKKVIIFNLRKFFVTLYFASSKFCFHTNVSLCKVFRTYENNFL